ncbi:CHAT domain-containing protein [Nostoc sp.]|uniref:CHAT domain-containing protein n=1 Tax=Nostoc sp. TaxID=1180 RepID=UPI002FFC02DB
MSNFEAKNILELLVDIDKINDPNRRAQELAELVPDLTTPNLLSEALKIAAGINNSATCAFVLSKLCPQLNAEQLLEALRIANNIRRPKSRVSAMAKLNSRLFSDLRCEPLKTVRLLISSKSYHACGEILGLISATQNLSFKLLTEAWSIVCDIDNTELNDSELKERCIHAIAEIDREILEKFPNSNRSEAAASLRAIRHEEIDREFCSIPRARAKVLAMLYCYLEGENQSQVLEKLLETIEEVPARPCKARTLINLAPYFPETVARRIATMAFFLLKDIVEDIYSPLQKSNDDWQYYGLRFSYATYREIESQLDILPTTVLLSETLSLLVIAEEILFGSSWQPNMIEGLPPELKSLIFHKGESSQKPRYLNAGFFPGDSEHLIPTDSPLSLDGGAYRLGVDVGEFWGIGKADQPIPDKVLNTFFEQQEILDLQVVANSLDIAIENKIQPLELAEVGNSKRLFFNLTLSKTKRQAIDIDLIFHGHLLQSRRVEVYVVAESREIPPESAFPLQNSSITFTRTVAISPEDLKALKENPRRLTIVAERSIDRNTIGLRFYDTTGNDLGFQESQLSEVNLSSALNAVRKQLLTTMTAYAGGVGGSEKILTKHLGQLAALGRKFYLALLPGLANPDQRVDYGQRLQVDLQPGTVIQVAPLSSQLGVPWEILYERKIEAYKEDRIKLCSTFKEHGLGQDDCPHCNDPTVVCPSGFWGYRYIVEQLPRRVDSGKPLPSHSLPTQIRNKTPLQFSANVFSGFNQLANHFKALAELASEQQLQILRSDSLDAIRITLKEAKADILYFYTHGGSDPFGSPYLEVGTEDQIQLIDLDAWGIKLGDRQPLVILNACDSADYTPDSFENLLKFFCDAGAAGVIGTQCEVKEHLANAFIIKFFQAFLKQAPAGEAMFAARQALLRDHLDPRGLVYSLCASAEVRLAQPVLV